MIRETLFLRQCSLNSSNVFLFFALLHGKQEIIRLSIECSPPLYNGVLWSKPKTLSPFPQYPHFPFADLYRSTNKFVSIGGHPTLLFAILLQECALVLTKFFFNHALCVLAFASLFLECHSFMYFFAQAWAFGFFLLFLTISFMHKIHEAVLPALSLVSNLNSSNGFISLQWMQAFI